MTARFDALHLAIRRSYWLARLTVAIRVLLAAAFIPTGIVKLLGRRFSVLSLDQPVGAFFETLYQTGLYWQFLGFMQVMAGVLVLIPRLAALGAVFYLAIMANIFVITLSMDFAGTPVVTGLMLLATLYLLAWDYHRWKLLLGIGPAKPPPALAPLRWAPLERALIVSGASGGMVLFLGTRNLVPPLPTIVGLIVAGVSALGLGAVWLGQDFSRRRRSP